MRATGPSLTAVTNENWGAGTGVRGSKLSHTDGCPEGSGMCPLVVFSCRSSKHFIKYRLRGERGKSYDLELEALGEPLCTQERRGQRQTMCVRTKRRGRVLFSHFVVAELEPRGLRLAPEALFFSDVACWT